MNTETQSPHPVGSSAWFGADVEKPETFNSVIVWGLLEYEHELDAHEGFWCGRNWWSVRQNETDPMAKKKLSGVTHWMTRPQAPNDKLMDRLPGASDSEPPVEGGSMQRLARHCPENSQQTKTQNP